MMESSMQQILNIENTDLKRKELLGNFSQRHDEILLLKTKK